MKWTDDEINFLKDNYSTKTNKEIGKILNRTDKSINVKLLRLNLKRNKEFIQQIIDINKANMPKRKWTNDDLKFLKENYATKTDEELSFLLKRTVRTISFKSYNLNLKKDIRKLSLENLKIIALKYKSRSEFQNKDSSAYSVAHRNSWIDEICLHMLDKKNFSSPQLILCKIIKIILNDENILYNTRKIIKPYELDVYSPKYKIAFEYDGTYYHNYNNIIINNDILKDKLCKEKGIKLIRIKEYKTKYKNYISDIKMQIIYNLQIINEYCNLNIIKNDIQNIQDDIIYDYISEHILTEDNVWKIINKYSYYIDFRKNEPILYEKIRKIKKLKYFTKNLIKTKMSWTLELINLEIDKYTILDDFIKNSKGCYAYIKRYNVNCNIDKLKRRMHWDFDLIIEIMKNKKYRITKQLKIEFPGAYNYIKTHKQLDYIKQFLIK
jgi:very-short-patch-repair endonuclease